ncbi:hypothetical protein N7491_010576 [Penicillium cf. griseofulvum]|uniref:Uncharacterized protein n=1 Tax=Penicillium cf. griseofulvum TaxID=2972120 RepID=A0A9W9N0H5_9EURO|nr:hypothetical protein N7472_000904 [Penicillium cf. griseofulvum]KAJ5422131.1 hypothetical protein N7491_010576 [Penicillium cf. griseofulvum]
MCIPRHAIEAAPEHAGIGISPSDATRSVICSVCWVNVRKQKGNDLQRCVKKLIKAGSGIRKLKRKASAGIHKQTDTTPDKS